MNTRATRLYLLLALIPLLLLAAACGGGGGSASQPPPAKFSNASLAGQYAFSMTGSELCAGVGSLFSRAGSFTADGRGNITTGLEDINVCTGTAILQFTGGKYSIDGHGRGTLQLTNSTGKASTGAALSTSQETMVPLSAFSHYGPGTTPLAVNHQGPFVAATLSFNLPEGESLSTATAAIKRTMQQLHVPISIHGEFAGTAKVFRQTVVEEPLLILASLVAVYIVLGVLYESLTQPITILSTLPSSGVGAVLALLLFGQQFTLIALIAVILLIGIVLKNAIMMVDVALETQRHGKERAAEAIHAACLLRFRPIMMTTIAAMLGALPLAVMTGQGSEMRQPLGIAIVGGLFISQILTLYTTPVVYIYLDRFHLWFKRTFRRSQRRLPSPASGAQPT